MSADEAAPAAPVEPSATKAVPNLSPVLMTVLNASTDAVVITDVDATIVSVNKTAERMFGYGAAEMIGRNVMMLMPEPFSSRHDSYVSRYRKTKIGHIGVGRPLLGLKKSLESFEMFLTLTEVKDGDLHVFCGFIKNLSGDGAGSQRDLLSTSSESPGASPSPEGRSHSFGTAANVSAWRFKSAGPTTGLGAIGSVSPLAPSPATVRAGSDDSIPWHQRTQLPPGSSSYWAHLPRDASGGGNDSGEVVAGAVPSGAGSGTPSSPLSIGSNASDNVTVITASSVPPKRLSGLEQCREIAFDELRFTQDKMIGRGAFGVVFAGEWRGVRVAVKQLIGYLDEEQISNVRAECALMQSCSNHPNIAKFIGLSCQGHTMCIVTQFYSNGSLHDAIIVRKMPFAARTKLRMLREAALGVIHLHKESVIHRDIAARNVLLDEHLNVVLSDFGLARVKTDAFHHTKSSLGPVKYMAPESISKKIFSFASDCFAFGVLIWELTHVAEPYADEPGLDTFGIAMGVVNGSLRLKIDESKSIGLADLMHDCWRANGADRPTFESVLQRLTLELDKQRGDSSSSGSATRVSDEQQGAAAPAVTTTTTTTTTTNVTPSSTTPALMDPTASQ